MSRNPYWPEDVLPLSHSYAGDIDIPADRKPQEPNCPLFDRKIKNNPMHLLKGAAAQVFEVLTVAVPHRSEPFHQARLHSGMRPNLYKLLTQEYARARDQPYERPISRTDVCGLCKRESGADLRGTDLLPLQAAKEDSQCPMPSCAYLRSKFG